MAISDIGSWMLVGAFGGMITSYFVNPDYTLLGTILGGTIGYLLGRIVR